MLPGSEHLSSQSVSTGLVKDLDLMFMSVRLLFVCFRFTLFNLLDFELYYDILLNNPPKNKHFLSCRCNGTVND